MFDLWCAHDCHSYDHHKVQATGHCTLCGKRTENMQKYYKFKIKLNLHNLFSYYNLGDVLHIVRLPDQFVDCRNPAMCTPLLDLCDLD